MLGTTVRHHSTMTKCGLSCSTKGQSSIGQAPTKIVEIGGLSTSPTGELPSKTAKRDDPSHDPRS